jgi:hypothetical protein
VDALAAAAMAGDAAATTRLLAAGADPNDSTAPPDFKTWNRWRQNGLEGL